MVKEVVRHFLRHPQVVDTLEGIAHWRLLQESIHHTVEEVDEALEWLVSRELLVRTERLGGAPIFGLNPAKAAEAKLLVEQEEGNAKDR